MVICEQSGFVSNKCVFTESTEPSRVEIQYGIFKNVTVKSEEGNYDFLSKSSSVYIADLSTQDPTGDWENSDTEPAQGPRDPGMRPWPEQT